MQTLSDSRVRYILDTNSSQFTVQVFGEGPTGHPDLRLRFAVREFTGEAGMLGARLESTTLEVAFQLSSLAMIDEARDEIRRPIENIVLEKALETKKYPTAVFKSSGVVANPVAENRYRVRIAGRLILHGIGNQHSFDAQVVASQDSLRLYGDFNLRQTDYGITINSVADGIVKIENELKVVFYCVARKQE